jgi:predicted nucleotidyltransferase component of viral defense system
MTKEGYFEMCEALGTAPVEEQIPVELADFPPEIQQAFEVYQVLQDVWEPMSGTYMGKNMNGISDLFQIYQVPQDERRFVIELIALIDVERSSQIDVKRKQEDSLKNKKSPP